jgi:hypothetical protein
MLPLSIHLFILGLFNCAFDSSDCSVKQQVTGQFKEISHHLPADRIARCLVQDVKPASLNYKEVLNIQPVSVKTYITL